MNKEKKFVWINRAVYIALIVACIIAIIVLAIPPSTPKLVKSECLVDNSYYDSSSYEVFLTFDKEVDDVSGTVYFYDENGDFLTSEHTSFYGYGEKTVSTTLFIDGFADSFSVENIVATAYYSYFNYFYIIILLLLIVLFVVICVELNYKEYIYDGHEIIAYAGYSHHYIKIDGEKTDEHNSVFFLTPIYLSSDLDENTVVSATISITNRISVKVNNRLIFPTTTPAKTRPSA